MEKEGDRSAAAPRRSGWRQVTLGRLTLSCDDPNSRFLARAPEAALRFSGLRAGGRPSTTGSDRTIGALALQRVSPAYGGLRKMHPLRTLERLSPCLFLVIASVAPGPAFAQEPAPTVPPAQVEPVITPTPVAAPAQPA